MKTNFSLNNKFKINRNLVLISLLVLTLLSGVYLRYAWQRYQADAKKEAIMLAQSLESVLHFEHIEKLSGSEADLENPDYISTKNSLIHLVLTTNPIRFAYIMVMKNTEVIILMDSELSDSADYSPPGQVYSEADDVLRNAFLSTETVLSNPTTDRWGTWISVLVPIQDHDNEEVFAIFGLDYSASEWYSNIWKEMIPDIIIVIFVIILFFAFLYSLSQQIELKKLNVKIAYNEAIYHSLFDQTPVGTAIMNDKNFVSQSEFGDFSINPMFETILGRNAQELAKVTWTEITHPEDLKADLERFEKFKAGEINGYSLEKRFIRPNGTIVWTNTKVSQFLGFSNSKQSYHICLIEDITSKKKIDDQLKESERSKSLLISNLPGMVYRCDYDENFTMRFVSNACVKLTGYGPESLINNRDISYKSLINPKYQELIRNEWNRIIAERLPFKYEYEIISEDGSHKWVLEYGEGVYSINGDVQALEGIVLDITDRKKAEELLEKSNERMHSMINNHEAAMLLIEPLSGKIIEANSAATTFYGYSNEEFLNMTIQDINTMDKDEIMALRLNVLNKGQKYFTFPHRLKNGEIKVVDVYSSPIEYDDKKVIFSIIFDVTEREKIAKQNEFLANHDYLTGLYNRKYITEVIEQRVKTNNDTIALLLGNIDGFKSLNDTLGHALGDEILIETANRLKDICIEGGILARVGGDEFAILVFGKDENQIQQCLKDLTQEFDKDIEDSVKDAIFSVSWGYGFKRKENDTLDEIYTEATAYMNSRKHYNRNSLRSKMVDVIMETLFIKSEREKRHSERVGELCEAVARKMNMTKPEIDRMRVAGLLHDIGKIGIEEDILNKKDRLTLKEWETMKLHPTKGASILARTIEYNDISKIVLSHHERYDGKGYPNGLVGNDIPIMARIVTVCDAYDAMTEQRTYRAPFSKEEAFEELRKCSGTQFDPEIVNVFINKVMSLEIKS